MKRMLWAVAVMGLAAAGTANADWGGFAPPPQQQGAQVQPARGEFSSPNTLVGLAHNHSGKAPDRYGLMPGLRKAFRVGGEGCDTCAKPGLFSKGGLFGGSSGGGCANGNCGNGHFGHGGGYGYDYPQYPPMMQGTLVFPN